MECSQINKDGTLIACSDAKKCSIFEWNGSNVKKIKSFDTTRARSLKFMDNNALVVAEFDGRILIIDMERMEIIETINSHSNRVIRHLEVSPCQNFIVTVDTMKKISVYNISTKKVILMLIYSLINCQNIPF